MVDKRSLRDYRWVGLLVGTAAVFMAHAAFSSGPDIDSGRPLPAGLAVTAMPVSAALEDDLLASMNGIGLDQADMDALRGSNGPAAAAAVDGGNERPPAAVEVTYSEHIVVSGESLGSIASRAGVSVSTLRSVNGIEGTVIHPGDDLRVPNMDGVLHRVRSGESLWALSRRFSVPIGKIVEANGISDPSSVTVGSRIFLPGARPAPGTPGGGPLFAWPVRGRLSSGFGYRRHPIYGRIIFHQGIDLVAPVGTTIRAARDGIVTFAGRRGGYGLFVEIRHPDGTLTRYAHNSRLLVRRGNRVRQGEPIARLGGTGRVTGPHLHFEIVRGGRRVDPLPILRGTSG